MPDPGTALERLVTRAALAGLAYRAARDERARAVAVAHRAGASYRVLARALEVSPTAIVRIVKIGEALLSQEEKP